MKKLTVLLLALIFGFSLSMARDRVSRDMSSLPKAAQTMINTHFGKIGLSHVNIDSKTFGGKEYDVILNDGTQIEFDDKGNWEEIERNNREAIPSALILAPINNYVSKNYKGQKIVQIKKDRNKYEVELSNGLDLEFDRAGNFRRIDD